MLEFKQHLLMTFTSEVRTSVCVCALVCACVCCAPGLGVPRPCVHVRVRVCAMRLGASIQKREWGRAWGRILHTEPGLEGHHGGSLVSWGTIWALGSAWIVGSGH